MTNVINIMGIRALNNNIQKINLIQQSINSASAGELTYDNTDGFKIYGQTGYKSLGEGNTSSYTGTNHSIVLSKSGVNLPFKGLRAGQNITLTPTGTNVNISLTQAGEINTVSTTTGNASIVSGKSETTFIFKTIYNSDGSITVTTSGDDIILYGSYIDASIPYGVFIGTSAGTGFSAPSPNIVGIGNNSCTYNASRIGTAPICCIGSYSGQSAQTGTIAIGSQAQSNSSSANSINIGYYSGPNYTEISGSGLVDICSVGIGAYVADIANNLNSVAIGYLVGSEAGTQSVSMGYYAAPSGTPFKSVSIGYYAAYQSISNANSIVFTGVASNVAIGSFAGLNLPYNAIVIGNDAGDCSNNTTQSITCGINTILIGRHAGSSNPHNNTIILNANNNMGTPIELNSTAASTTLISSIRSIANSWPQNVLKYNTTTKEVTYQTYATEGAKTFVINHPLYDDKYLVHVCMESPESGVMYRGECILKNNEGSKIIYLPSYCTEWSNYTINITAIDSLNINMYTSDVSNNMFTIHGDDGVIHWTVYATRDSIVVEPDINSTTIHGNGPYKYI